MTQPDFPDSLLIEQDIKKLLLLYKHSSDLICLLKIEDSKTFRLIEANPAYLQKIGIKKEELLGRIHSDVLPPKEAAYALARYQEAIQAQKPIYYEESGAIKGKRFTMEVTMIPILNNAQVCTHLLGIARDITWQRRTEQRLIENEELFRQMAEHSSDVFWLKDLSNNQLLYLSPALEKVWGVPVNACMENPLLLLDFAHPDDRELFKSCFDCCYDEVYEIHCRVLTRDGKIRWVRMRGFPIVNEKGNVYRRAGIAEEITDIKKQEELLQKSTALSLIGRLAASVAHEIRNPLTSLKGFLQLLDSTSTPNPHHLQIMRQELVQLETIVTDFLLLSAPLDELTFQLCSMEEILKGSLSSFDTHLINSHISVRIDKEESLLPVRCEANLIKKAFTNIIENAVDAMPEGGQFTIHLQSSPTGRIGISFTDTGQGLPRERAEMLGMPFYSTTEKGTGLGLMLSRKIIESHGGSFHVTSKPGQGTSILVLLPIGNDC